ncbi:MAG: 6-phosphogluconolactonase [Nitrosomonas sp.]|nr:6-phosphogluconolactonase [Nitrosomonas sp.]
MTGNMHSRIKRNVFSNIDTLAHGFADYAAEILSLALEKQQSASLVVPGGNTPRSYLPALAAKPLPWNRVTITLSDERWVDIESEDSNEYLVKKFMLNQLPQKAHFVGLKTWHDTPDEAIPEIDQRLGKITLPFTLTVLGLGEDGHIASLFLGLQLHEPQQNAMPSHCLAIYPPISPTPRISLSLDVLARSEKIALVVTGHSKRKLLDQLSDNPDPRVPLVWLLQWSQSTITVFETDR